MKKKLLCILMLAILAVLPASVLAAGISNVFIGGTNTENAPGKQVPIDAVSILKTKGGYRLFLCGFFGRCFL